MVLKKTIVINGKRYKLATDAELDKFWRNYEDMAH